MRSDDWKPVPGDSKRLSAPAIRAVQLEFYRQANELQRKSDKACLDALAAGAETP